MAVTEKPKPLSYRLRVASIQIERPTDYEGKTFAERQTRTHFTLEVDGPPTDYREGRMNNVIYLNGYAGVWDITDVTAQVKLGDIFELRQLPNKEKKHGSH